MESIFFGILLLALFIYVINKWFNKKKTNWIKPTTPFPNKWRSILATKVLYYNNLSLDNKLKFEYKVFEFLLNCKITGVNTTIDETDKILVASSAIIPIFSFPEWKYLNLSEVLIYPNAFDEKFNTKGENRNILGMVGTGYMEGKMILSKEALHKGFSNSSDKKNTAIHEFVHLIDKLDGNTDGIPKLLLEQQYTIPWLNLIHSKIEDIANNESDINPYGATNKTEFFAVASEYFFERPKLLQRKHPKLYNKLEQIFNQKMASIKTNKVKREINRNDPCVCGSKLKFKKCCGK